MYVIILLVISNVTNSMSRAFYQSSNPPSYESLVQRELNLTKSSAVTPWDSLENVLKKGMTTQRRP